jgi:hypothetical protein
MTISRSSEIFKDSLGFVTQGVLAISTIREDGTVFVKDFMTNGQFLFAAFEPDEAAKPFLAAAHKKGMSTIDDLVGFLWEPLRVQGYEFTVERAE